MDINNIDFSNTIEIKHKCEQYHLFYINIDYILDTKNMDNIIIEN